MTSPTGQYGTIPFDIFALEQWDHSLPRNDDDIQWADVVRKYLSLTSRERFHYHRASMAINDVPEDETDPMKDLLSLLTPSSIARVLSTENNRQTQQERTISARRRAADIGGDGDGSVDSVMILDDAGRYDHSIIGKDIDDVVTTLIRRIPGFCDGLQGSVIEDYDGWDFMRAGDGEGEDEKETPLESASRRAAGLVYLADEEAVEEHVVKLLWPDVHGRCVWRNKTRPEELMGLTGAFIGGYFLAEAVESYGLFGNPGE